MYLKEMTYRELSEEIVIISRVIEGTKAFMENAMMDCPFLREHLLALQNQRRIFLNEAYRRAELIPTELLMADLYDRRN
jgi:hypothetical protein